MSQESNPGRIDGNNVFCRKTADAVEASWRFPGLPAPHCTIAVLLLVSACCLPFLLALCSWSSGLLDSTRRTVPCCPKLSPGPLAPEARIMQFDQAANDTYELSFKPRASETKAECARASGALLLSTKAMWTSVPHWPSRQGVGLRQREPVRQDASIQEASLKNCLVRAVPKLQRISTWN